MSDIQQLRSSLTRALDQEERTRDEAFSMSRDIIRSCRKAISELVMERDVDLDGIREDVGRITDIDGWNVHRFAFVEDALAEYCEAEILRSILNGDSIPHPDHLGVPERVYVLGACDTVGELRRVTLNRLLRSEIEGAVSVYESMKEIGEMVAGLAYPTGMIPLKKKQDVVRSLLDRTGGELLIALHSQEGRNKDKVVQTDGR
ncbi:MAG: hypothetical protein ACMUHY_02715 [Thermoplasmatota archaeon]